MEATEFQFRSTVNTLFIGDRSSDIIKALQKKATRIPRSKPPDVGVKFHGLAFNDVLVCVWHIPSDERYRAVANAYMKPGMCDIIVVTYDLSSAQSFERALANLSRVVPQNGQRVMLLEVYDSLEDRKVSMEGGEGSESFVKYKVGLQDIGPLVTMLTTNLNGSYQRGSGLEPHEHDFSDFSETHSYSDMVDIPLDDDDDVYPQPTHSRLNTRKVLEGCQTHKKCAFL